MRQPSLFDEPEIPSFPSERVEQPPAWVPLADLAPEAAGPRLTGIARLAAEAEEMDYRNEVEYRDLACRSIISGVRSQRVPFEYGINPYRGCEFGCVYCYARYTHEYMEFQDWLDFERKVFVKQGAREALLKDLRRLDLNGKWVAIGTATDPYQPAERRYRLTRSLLEVFAGRRGLKVSITTKSDLVTRDLDLLTRLREGNRVHVNVTVTTPHYELSRRLEPRAPRPDRRLGAVKALAAAGIRVGVFMMPLLPRINDRLEDMEQLVAAARDARAKYVVAHPLFLRNCSRKRFYPFIEAEFPELLPYYRRLYAGNHTESLASYTRQKKAEFQALKQKYGFVSAGDDLEMEGFQPDQLVLEAG